MDKVITVQYGDLQATYCSKLGFIYHKTKNKIVMEIHIPKNWASTRIVQFMDSLLNN